VVAARNSGFRTDLVEDISHRTEHFWTTTLQLIKTEARDNKAKDITRLQRSYDMHALVRQGLRDRGLLYALLSFSM